MGHRTSGNTQFAYLPRPGLRPVVDPTLAREVGPESGISLRWDIVHQAIPNLPYLPRPGLRPVAGPTRVRSLRSLAREVGPENGIL